MGDVRVVEGVAVTRERYIGSGEPGRIFDDAFVCNEAAGVYAVLSMYDTDILHDVWPRDPMYQAALEACRGSAPVPLSRLFSAVQQQMREFGESASMVALRARERVVEIASVGECRVVLYRQSAWHELLTVPRLSWDPLNTLPLRVGSDGVMRRGPHELEAMNEFVERMGHITTRAIVGRAEALVLDSVRFVPRPGDVVLMASPGVFGRGDDYLWWPSRVLRSGGTLAQKAEAIVTQLERIEAAMESTVALVEF